MNAFAGFWVDGAVRKPEKRHGGNRNAVYVQWKDGSDIGTCNTNSVAVRWENLFWLDTTPRESLTPEELLSVVNVIWPNITKVFKLNSHQWYIADESTNALIDWGNLVEYPPPVEPQWIRITRENVGQYLFRLCRCRDSESDAWQNGHIVGWDIEDEDCLVDGDFNPIERALKFGFVEVQA